MIILTGNSLGERQKDLNERVNKAAAGNAFHNYETEPGANDVDKIFMIDVAAKNKNIDVILETLKSGDIVHITRGLKKCTWLVDDEFDNIINVDNLHLNIFPLMSIKMKKKLLCTLSINLKNENRSIAFYEYCIKEKLLKIAMKFLFNTPKTYKHDVILQKSEAFNMMISEPKEVLPKFIGNSFTLAYTFLDTMEDYWNKGNFLESLHFLYTVSSGQYLDMLEKYNIIENSFSRFGHRLSKEIIKKHKDRVLKNPLLYVNILNKDKIAKNSTMSDVKVYAVALLPEEASTFWNMNFYKHFKFILDIIPVDERFSFIKTIFNEKYPNEKFEMSKQFYSCKFYVTMTTEEKEYWALRHIKSDEEILGSGYDYIWYKFVSFEKAFEEIKKYILITQDNETRKVIINVLIDSAKTQKDLENLLNYYYNRHVNELRCHKERFLDYLFRQHKVFEFNEECWAPLEKIFYSLNVFDTSNNNRTSYRAIALIYYIIRGKTVLAVLDEFIDNNVIDVFEVKRYNSELGSEKSEMVFQYFRKFYLTAVEALACKEYNKDEKNNVDKYILGYLDLLHGYSKTKDEIPEIIHKFIKLNRKKFIYHRLLAESGKVAYSEKNIMHHMKTDANLIIEEFPLIQSYIEDRFGRTNWLVRKLKIYFHHDIAQTYLQILNDCLSTNDVHYRMVQVAVYGILKLADESFKNDFVQKHVPTNPKIDHAKISQDLLRIQRAICGHACVSRPPLPMPCIIQYITGDYVHYCLPIFNSYLMNLPLPVCIKFVESIIDKPISVQKHGLRLAFHCFSTEHLKVLISGAWKRAKNISLRKILYKSLFDKVLKENDQQTQLELFEVLKTLTLNLHQDDVDEIFLLLTHNKMPNHLVGQHLVNAWSAVKKLPERSVNFKRMTKVIQTIENNFNLVPEDDVTIITDHHVSKMLDEKQILNTNNNTKNNLEELLKAKWELTLRYLANVNNEKQLQNNLGVVRHIIKRCLEMWNEVREEKYVMREFCRSFIIDLERKSRTGSYPNMKIMYDTILTDLQKSLPEHEIFTLTWQLRLSEITMDIIVAGRQEFQNPDEIVLAIRTCVLRFSEAFVVLLKEYINNGKYFAAFHSQIDSYAINKLAKVNSKIDFHYKLNLKLNDLSVLMCVGLLKFEMPEVYLLILRVLPVNYSGIFDSDYEQIISKLKVFKNTEVQYFMFEKFVNCDFMFRSLMQT